MGRKLVDLTGQVFDRLTVMHRAPTIPHKKPQWVCRCVCGEVRTIDGSSLKRKLSTSCGCFQREDMSRRKTTTGLRKLAPDAGIGGDKRVSSDPTLETWSGMRTRCNNPKAARYASYGGRGIKVCARWDKFENFFDDMGPRPPNMTLDRKNNDGDYEPDNCRWATAVMQMANQRDRFFNAINPRVLTDVDKALIRQGLIAQRSCLSLAREYNVSPDTIREIRDEQKIALAVGTVTRAAIREEAARVVDGLPIPAVEPAVLTDEDLETIRTCLANGQSALSLARAFDVSPDTIRLLQVDPNPSPHPDLN